MLLLINSIGIYAQEGAYTHEEITVDILDDNLHPPQLLRTRKLNKYDRPVYEENYYLCHPTKLTGCDRDSSELQNIVLYEYVQDTILVKKTTYNVPMRYLHAEDDTTIISYTYNKQNKPVEEFSIHYGLPVWGETSVAQKSWNDATNTYHRYDRKGRLTEDLIVRADRPGRGMTGYDPEDKVKYYYDDTDRLTRAEHYNVWSMGNYGATPRQYTGDTTLTFIFNYQYEDDRHIKTVVQINNDIRDTVNTIIHYNDPYRNVLPDYVKTPKKTYTIHTYNHQNKLIRERTYGGADNRLMTEKKY